MACTHRFSAQRRTTTRLIKQLWCAYVFHKQTIRELTQTYKRDRRVIRRLLQQYRSPPKLHYPRPVHLVVDATYFGERVEGTAWCVLVARDAVTHENLAWRFADTETTLEYRVLRDELEVSGYTILSVTGDGFSGIKTAFPGIPYQMCHVHMERIVTQGTTRNPKTEQGAALLALVRTLHQETNSHLFYTRLSTYLELCRDFLNEKTFTPETGKWDWTHRPLRQAALSLERHRPYLFTFEHNTQIPKTTNSLEGQFSHLKDVLGIHRGVSRSHAQRILHLLLLASTIAPTEERLEEIL